MTKLVKIVPETQNGELSVLSATIRIDGLENIRGKSRRAFNRHVADLLPTGQKAVIYHDEKPQIVKGRHPVLAA